MLDVIAQNIRNHHANARYRPVALHGEQMLMLAQYNVFPNATVLVSGDMLNVLLGLPGATPDQSELVTYTFYRGAVGRRAPHEADRRRFSRPTSAAPA